MPRKADLTISAAYPLERGNQSTKSLASAAAVTKSAGQIIWVAPQPDRDQLIPFVNEVSSSKSTNEYHRQLVEGKYPDIVKSKHKIPELSLCKSTASEASGKDVGLKDFRFKCLLRMKSVRCYRRPNGAGGFSSPQF